MCLHNQASFPLSVVSFHFLNLNFICHFFLNHEIKVSSALLCNSFFIFFRFCMPLLWFFCSYSSLEDLISTSCSVCPYQMPLITLLHCEKWLQTYLFFFFLGNLILSVRMILFQYSLCFQLLYSVALWHGVQAALYRAIKAWRVAAGNHRGGDRLLTKLMLLSHCEKVPTIFVLGAGLLKTDVIHRIWWRNVN